MVCCTWLMARGLIFYASDFRQVVAKNRMSEDEPVVCDILGQGKVFGVQSFLLAVPVMQVCHPCPSNTQTIDSRCSIILKHVPSAPKPSNIRPALSKSHGCESRFSIFSYL